MIHYFNFMGEFQVEKKVNKEVALNRFHVLNWVKNSEILLKTILALN